MSISITRPGKQGISIDAPVLNAAGILGFADEYRDLVNLDRLGAFVTNPITLGSRSPVSGSRVAQLDAGLLVHTGLPNGGLSATLRDYRGKWAKFTIPVILHLVANTPDEMRRMMERLEEMDEVAGVEIGLNDDARPAEMAALVRAAAQHGTGEKPVLARLPFASTLDTARMLVDAGADGLIACAPPRGTARDGAGRLIPGRLYGPLTKPLLLRLVGQMARSVGVPLVGAGGIHTPQDARDYLEAGAAAVQVDSAVWVRPKLIEWIAADLGGAIVTQPITAMADEWHAAMTDSERSRRAQDAGTKEEGGR